jgi:GNAT superfamily N-acetyltransferase
MKLEFHPLTPDRWSDFEALFGPRGATGGCWCMFWKLKRSEFDAQKHEGNRQAMKQVVEGGTAPGILAYADGRPVGWCAVEPRDHYPALNRSRILKAVDDTAVWSITCFFVDKTYRRQGVTGELLRAAVAYVQEQGGQVVEGYPVEPKNEEMPAVFAWTGFADTFRQAGFIEVARRSETRPIMRYTIDRL